LIDETQYGGGGYPGSETLTAGLVIEALLYTCLSDCAKCAFSGN